MIELKYGNEVYELRNTPDELTLNEFDIIFSLVNSQRDDNVSKYFQVFSFLKVPDKVLDSLSQKEFIELVKNFNDYQLPNDLVEVIEINGRIYRTMNEGDTFEFKARDISLLEQAQLKNDGHFPSWIAAILYKDEQLTNTEHRDWTHIKHKAELFRKNVKAAVVIPYLVRVAKKQISEISEAV